MPMTIVMGMVAGVFLRFGLDLVRAVHQDVAIAAPMVLAFVALSALPRLSGRIPTLLSVLMPPMIGALLVGALAIAWGGRMDWSGGSNLALIAPALYRPAFSLPVLLELVVPLAITVLVVQNGQGYAVLKSVGHAAPVNAVTLACGSASMLTTFVGSVSTCLTGPTNAIVSSSGERHRHYTGAIVVGLLAVAFGLFASAFTTVMLATPKAFIATLGGLAMLRALQGSFTTAFSGSYPLGALVAFLITVTDLPILNVGAAFWGLVFGMATSFLLERRD
jgi:benzoate membrane transport protein